MNPSLPSNIANFSLIKFVSIDIKAEGEQVNLTKLFDAVINGLSLEVNRKHLEHIFRHDLMIDTETLDKRLCQVLCEALIYYMTEWPGWQRFSDYRKGELQSKEWFERYRQYLMFKSKFIIKNSTRYAEYKADVTETETQTDVVVGRKPAAPYTLILAAPPSVLNSIVFMENSDNDIVIKQHLEKTWQLLDLKQFLNWPYLSVEVKLPDVSLTRTNAHVFDRSLCLRGDSVLADEVNHITHITKVPDIGESDLTPYTYKYFFFYFLQLNQVLSRVSGISAGRLNELALIFAEFVNDVKEINIYNTTMSTYVTVGYNIGGSRYIRNKKMINGTLNRMEPIRNIINFYEVIIPQIELSLNYFKAVQNLQDKQNISFDSLNLFLRKLSDPKNPDVEKLRFVINNTCVTYSCKMCNEYCSGPNAYELITKHFADKHKAEQSVICYKCRKQFEFKALAEQRWSHDCKL